MTLLLFFFVLSILFSFLCSIWEAVILSVTPSYVQRQVNEKTRTGQLLKEYKEDIDRPLSAILTLNTIAHTVGAIGVGAQAGQIFGENYLSVGPVSLSYESIIATLMTLAILILSEIIPKTLGANNWQTLAPFTVRSIKFLMIVLKPLVWLSQRITKTMKKDKSKSVLSRGDFTAMAMVGEKSGVLKQQESNIIKNLLRLEKLHVKDIMTPRTVVFTSPEETTVKDFVEATGTRQFSRIPIYSGNSDNITGLVLKDEVFLRMAQGQSEKQLKELSKPVKFIQENFTLQQLFDFLVEQRVHLCVVVDEYGALAGVVSQEDLFESLLGREIMDESDRYADLRQLAKDRWEEKLGRSEDSTPTED
ncbi:MAG TPA: hemolysin family protein [Saprospiraceae bacterium]|nr:hemolysin family protein [Saprospiraceae bacterium]